MSGKPQPPNSPRSPLLPTPSSLLPASDRIFTVTELIASLRSLVERTYAHITVEGEISNWRPSASGHCYFTLKDGAAQLSIVLFRRQAQLLRFKPKDGDAVRIRGQLSVYDARGQLQLIAESMQQTGLGALLAAVQELKVRLRREGLFDNARPLPQFPRCIGIVTSLQGAALRDIVKVCRRRHAAANLLIYPAAVQGPNCPTEIAAGITWFSNHATNKATTNDGVPHISPLRCGNEDADGATERSVTEAGCPIHDGSIVMSGIATTVDVVLVARGGGSWEDLHGFDHELVVRAIAACSVPVITGIGHATDSVLADSAADLCAPTPSAAAEILTAGHFGLTDRLTRLHARLLRATRYELLRTQQRLAHLSAESVLRRAHTTLERRSQRLDDLTNRASSALERNSRRARTNLTQLEARLARRDPALRLSEDRRRLSALQSRLTAARTLAFTPAQRRLARASSQLDALSPLRVLERGYALVYAPNGQLLRDPADAPPNTQITAQLARGRLRATVTSTE
jgi:exodeoxyribonuclease VII large subunit